MLDLAGTLPEDFQADVLLRMSDAPDLLPAGADAAERKNAAAELALRASNLAMRSARRLPGLASVGYAQGEDELHAMQTNGLDQLSLQARASNLLEKYAPEHALPLLAALPLPGKAACDADYIDDATVHFELLGGMWPGDAARRADAIIRRVDAGQHETEILPALQLGTSSAAIDDAHVAPMAASLQRLLARARGDDAAFTVTELGVANQVQLMLQRLDAQPALRNGLHQAYHDYVQAHLHQPRCAASVRGNHWLLEQRYVAELPPEQITPPQQADAAVPGDSMLDLDPVELIREAGFNVRARLLDSPDEDHADQALEVAGNAFLDQVDSGPVAAAATQDTTGRIRRAQYVETLRYLEYAPTGAARERGFALLFGLMSGKYYVQDHDTWFGDLTLFARNAEHWPDRAQRLAQLRDAHHPVLEEYAMLMQRNQFP